jgi:hypothetical protein
VIAKFYPAFADVLSTRTLFGLFAGAQYTLRLGDGLVRVGVQSETEAELDRLADGSFQANFRVVTPRLGFGRLLVDTKVLHRYRNFLNTMSWLGGDGRLRGYPSNYFVGESEATSNVEFRSRPLELLTLQLGGVAFYDTGVVWDRSSALDVHQSVGFGIRTLLPQLDRIVFRVDLGFPVERGGLPPGVAPFAFFLAVGQAFPMPTAPWEVSCSSDALVSAKPRSAKFSRAAYSIPKIRLSNWT